MKRLLEYWKKNRDILVWRVKDYFWWLRIYYRRLVWTYVVFNLLLAPIAFGIVYLDYKMSTPKQEVKQVCIKPRVLEGCEAVATSVNRQLMTCEFQLSRLEERYSLCKERVEQLEKEN